MKVIFLVVLLGLMAQVAATATAPEDAVAGKTQCAFRNEVNDPFLWETDKCASGSAKLYCSPLTTMCESAPVELPQCGACMKVTHKEGEDPCVTGIKACLTTEKNPWEKCTNEDQLQFFGWMTGEKCMAALRASADDGHDDHPVKFCGGGEYVKNKDTHDEKCEKCPAGKFSKDNTFRNRRCKKCPEDTYMPYTGQTSCVKCPANMNTKDQRGKKQCFDPSGVSMKALNMDPKDYAPRPEAKDEPVDHIDAPPGGNTDTTGDGSNIDATPGGGSNTGTTTGGDSNTGTTTGGGSNTGTTTGDGSNTGTTTGDGSNTGTTTGDDPTDGGNTEGKSCTYSRECGKDEICSGYDYSDGYDSAKTYKGVCTNYFDELIGSGVSEVCTYQLADCFEQICRKPEGESYYEHEGPNGIGNSACCFATMGCDVAQVPECTDYHVNALGDSSFTSDLVRCPGTTTGGGSNTGTTTSPPK